MSRQIRCKTSTVMWDEEVQNFNGDAGRGGATQESTQEVYFDDDVHQHLVDAHPKNESRFHSAGKSKCGVLGMSCSRNTHAVYALAPSVPSVMRDDAPSRPQRMAGHSKAAKKPARMSMRPAAVDLLLEPVSPVDVSPTRERSLLTMPKTRSTYGTVNHAVSGVVQDHAGRCKNSASQKELQWDLENCSPQCSPVRNSANLQQELVFGGTTPPHHATGSMCTTRLAYSALKHLNIPSSMNRSTNLASSDESSDLNVPPIEPFFRASFESNKDFKLCVRRR